MRLTGDVEGQAAGNAAVGNHSGAAGAVGGVPLAALSSSRGHGRVEEDGGGRVL